MRGNKVIHFFGNVMMTNGHKGLAELAGNKVDIDSLRPGEFVAFVNKPFTAMKLLGPKGILVYWKQPSHRALFREVVDTLPEFLSGTEIGFSNDVVAAITRYYRRFLLKRGGGKKVAAAKLRRVA